MKELTDKLAAIGAPISEEDQVVTVLGSLPPSYATLVTALEARVDDVSLKFVQQALIHEEQKRSNSASFNCTASVGFLDITDVIVQENKQEALQLYTESKLLKNRRAQNMTRHLELWSALFRESSG